MIKTDGGSPDELFSRAAEMCNWGRWGEDDELGTLNFITPAKRVAASALVRRGVVFSLSLPLDSDGPIPPANRRFNPRHMMIATGTDYAAGVQEHAYEGWGYADDIIIMPLQAATQWDGLAHIFHDGRMYNGYDCRLVDAHGAHKNGIDKLADQIVTRGVLLDVARAHDQDCLPPGYEISPSDIEATLKRQRSLLEPGDVALIRTGSIARAKVGASWHGYMGGDAPGLGLDALAWLHEAQVAAAATDTWAFEVIPTKGGISFPVHIVAIVYMGLLIGEMFLLDYLADDCEEDRVYDFLFCAPPLPVTGGVGSPVNALAIK